MTTTYAYSVWPLLASAGDVPQTAMAQCRLALDPVDEQFSAAINQPAGDTLLHRRNAGGQYSFSLSRFYSVQSPSLPPIPPKTSVGRLPMPYARTLRCTACAWTCPFTRRTRRAS